MICVRHGQKKVDLSHFEQAVERVIGGIERKLPEYEAVKPVVAIHECGHAVTSWFLKGGSPLLKALSSAYYQTEIKRKSWFRSVPS